MNKILQNFFQTATTAEVRETLDFLLNECSVDEQPDPADVWQWQHDLQQRGGQFVQIAQEFCVPFLAEHDS